MEKINPIDVTNSISAAIRVGGAALSIVNPVLGISVVGIGEIIPIIANKINNSRKDTFIKSVNSNINASLSQVDYSENPDVYDQILDTVRKAMLTESDYTIFLMGKITATVINENRRYTQNELQLIDALYRMNDYDFINFIVICNQISEFGKKSGNDILVDEADLCGEGDSSKDNVVFTLKKLNGLNLFDYCPAAMFDGDDDMQTYYSSNFYSMNSLTKDLLKLIENGGKQ